MPKSPGRKAGYLIHAEGFEAILAAKGHLKKDVAQDAGLSPGFLADLLAHRGGASPEVAERLASTIGVKVAALFPGVVGWAGPFPDRDGKRKKAAA